MFYITALICVAQLNNIFFQTGGAFFLKGHSGALVKGIQVFKTSGDAGFMIALWINVAAIQKVTVYDAEMGLFIRAEMQIKNLD